MAALVRYWFALAVASQRLFAPTLVFLAGLFALTTGQSGPLSDPYGTATAILFVATLWVMIALLQLERREQTAVTAVNAGSWHQPAVAGVVANGSIGLAMVVVGLVVPILDGHHHVTVAAVTQGALSEGAGALMGIAVGVLCSRLVVARTMASVTAAFLLGFVVVRMPWASPLHEILRRDALDDPPAHELLPLAALTLGCLAFTVAASVASIAISRRRA